jgi:predicted TIM-barrel fold metal-dependent hydrolase
MATQSTQDQIEKMTIVDADAHVYETLEDLYPYMNDNDLVRTLQTASDPKYKLYSLARSAPHSHLEAPNVDVKGAENYTQQRSNDTEMKLEDMGAFDIDYSLVGPTLNLAHATINNSSYAVTVANAYNSYLLDKVADESKGIKGFALAAHQEPHKAAEEIDRRASEDDIVGVLMSSVSLLPPAGSKEYDPIYEAAQDNGLPIVYHGSSMGFPQHFPMQFQHMESSIEHIVFAHPYFTIASFISVFTRGLPGRFPDLDFIFQECGIGWVPYWSWRLDDRYLTMGDEVPHLDKLPSQYIGDQVYVNTQPLGHTHEDPMHMAKMLELVGPDAVMFSADLPHPNFDSPSEFYDRIRSTFNEDTIKEVMGKNALSVHGV